MPCGQEVSSYACSVVPVEKCLSRYYSHVDPIQLVTLLSVVVFMDKLLFVHKKTPVLSLVTRIQIPAG